MSAPFRAVTLVAFLVFGLSGALARAETPPANAPPPEPVSPRACEAGFEDWRSFHLREWFEKAEAGIPGHDPRVLHLVYEEWIGRAQHLRVSLRGSGDYVIELDGISGWNPTARHDGARRLWSKSGTFVGRIEKRRALALLREHHGVVNEPSCTEACTGFHATATMVAEFGSLAIGRGVWTSRDCPGFPKALADAMWALARERSRGAVRRAGSEPRGK